MRNLLALLLALLFCFSCVTSYAEGSRESSPQESVLKNGDYEYVVDEDGNAKLLSYSWDSHKDGGDVIIPSVIDGHSVKTIGTHCFAPDTRLGLLLSLLHAHHQQPALYAAETAVTGDQGNNVVSFRYRNAGIIEGLCPRTVHELHEGSVILIHADSANW